MAAATPMCGVMLLISQAIGQTRTALNQFSEDMTSWNVVVFVICLMAPVESVGTRQPVAVNITTTASDSRIIFF